MKLPSKNHAKPVRLVDAPPPIAPLDTWDTIADPKGHVAAMAGKYLAMYEGVMNYCMQTGDIALGRAMLLDLMRLTEVGRQKADLHVGPAGEIDLSHLNESELLKLVGKEDA